MNVGSEAAMLKTYGSDNVRRMERNIAILPGLYDAHGHVLLVYNPFLITANLSMVKC
jgi:predicted amidohydrolase YtcJ